MSEPTLIVVGDRRRRGRPMGSKSSPEAGSTLSAWVPASLHDKAVVVALKRDISLSKLVCEALRATIVAETSR